ncbi:extracellular solute-binding protein [Streptomyces sp. NPDC059740]|uniref:extracellular solute-binding protein n=1 Tax=Streptomyces sp. NPDC059740 TaxID=3346926 RepID=UPI003659CB01
MRTKLLLALASSAVLSVTATGCGGSALSSDGKTIKVVYQQQLNAANKIQANYLKPMAAKFEKAHPGTKVQLVPVTASENDYYTKIQLMMRSPATAPDLVFEDTATINSDVASGYLRPLDDYLAKWKDWDQYPKASRTGVTSVKDGKVYGVPDDTDTRGIWYNKKIFAKAGIALPWQPRTWAEVMAAAEKIKKQVPGVVPLNVYTGKASGEMASMQGLEMLLYGTPAGDDALYDAGKKKWVVGSKGFRDALTFVHDLYGHGLGPSASQALGANFNNTVTTELLPEGKLAMNLDGSWLPNQWLATGPKPWKAWQSTMGQAAMPTQNGQAPGRVSLSGGWAWSIAAKAKNPDLAWKFATFLTSRDATAKWNVVNGTLAPRKDSAADPGYLRAVPTNKFFTSLVPDTHYRPGLPTYPQVSTAIQKAMESVTTGQSSVTQAAAAYDKDVAAAVGAGNTVKGDR